MFVQKDSKGTSKCTNLDYCLSPTESLFESVLPPEISMETFAKDILGFSAATQELQEHEHDL